VKRSQVWSSEREKCLLIEGEVTYITFYSLKIGYI
jgi:hypothetical protein